MESRLHIKQGSSTGVSLSNDVDGKFAVFAFVTFIGSLLLVVVEWRERRAFSAYATPSLLGRGN